jgi:hypothetical protein
MSLLSHFARLTGIGLTIWALGRGIRTAHRLDRSTSVLRWTVVISALAVVIISFETNIRISDLVFLIATFNFLVFLLLPDLPYYIMLGIRAVAKAIRRSN